MTRPGQTTNPGAPARVLVVDDHEISRQYTVAALRQSGAAVKAGRCPEAALATALSWRPGIIFVDIELAGMDGYEWMRRLHEAWPDDRPLPRLVVLSAHRCGPGAPDAACVPVAAVLSKPATPSDLRAVLLTAGDDAPAKASAPVSAAGPGPGPAVRRLFRHELAGQLLALDRLLSRRDLAGALPVLHQLIASCRICRQERLEASLRALQARCREGAAAGGGASGVAQCYYAVRASAGYALRTSAA